MDMVSKQSARQLMMGATPENVLVIKYRFHVNRVLIFVLNLNKKSITLQKMDSNVFTKVKLKRDLRNNSFNMFFQRHEVKLILSLIAVLILDLIYTHSHKTKQQQKNCVS